ncbi:hypothetical protein KKH18_07040 [bacterium]|nr:hypothetical protein [bacterium]
MSDKVLGIILKAQTDIDAAVNELKSGLKDAERQAATSAKKTSEEYEQAFTKIRNASAIAFAAVGASIGFATNTAIKQEDAVNKARAQVRLAGGDWEAYGDQVLKAAAAIQEHSRYGDEELLPVYARMVAITGDYQASLENLNIVADAAAGLQIDISTAGDYVARAMTGQAEMLGRLLPSLREKLKLLGEDASAEQKAALAIQELGRMSGSAAADVETVGGALSQLKATAGDTTEEIGNAFLPLIKDMAKELRSVAKGVGEWVKEHTELVKVLGTGAIVTTGFLAFTTSAALILPRIAAGVAAFTTAASALTGVLTFQTAALWGNSLAWNAVGVAMLSVPGWGWALAGVAALGTLAYALSDFEYEAQDTPQKIEDINAALIAMNPAAADATSAVQNLAKITADEFNKLKDDNELTLIGEEFSETTKQAMNDAADAIADSGPKVREGAWKLGIQAGEAWKEALASQTQSLNDALEWEDKGDSGQGLVASEAESIAALESLQADHLNWKRAQDKAYLTERQALLNQALAAGVDAEAAAQIIMTSKTNEQALARFELYRQEYQAVQDMTAGMQNAFLTGMQSITDAEMTGKARREAIWNSYRATVIRQIAESVNKFIFGEMAKRAAMAATGVVAKQQVAEQAAVEHANVLKSIALSVKAIAAKIYSFYASMGPFGLPLAAATVAAAIAAIRTIKLQTGGIVPGSGRGDTVPALLESGEFVVNRSATNQYRALLEQINFGSLRRPSASAPAEYAYANRVARNEAQLAQAVASGALPSTAAEQSHVSMEIHLDRDTNERDVARIKHLLDTHVVEAVEAAIDRGAFRRRFAFS